LLRCWPAAHTCGVLSVIIWHAFATAFQNCRLGQQWPLVKCRPAGQVVGTWIGGRFPPGTGTTTGTGNVVSPGPAGTAAVNPGAGAIGAASGPGAAGPRLSLSVSPVIGTIVQ